MPLDFECPVCKHRIRVPDGNEGKRTKCPKCNAIQNVPDAADSFGGGDSAFGGQASAGGPDIFGDLPSQSSSGSSESYGSPQSSQYDDPYAAQPSYTSQVSANAARSEAIEKIGVPALLCMVLTVLGLVINLAILVVVIIAVATDPGGNIIWGVLQTGLVAFAICLQGLAIFGLSQARQLRSAGLAWTGFLIAMLPLSVCCILTLPISFWGMTVLSDGSVQRQFDI